ncbi:MAG TPA: CsbD family protein [Gemmataceae bacterium]|nr:CsbD family protein [Gemmataceae bacterium]
MNWDQIAGDWKQFRGKVKEKWGKLTDDDLTAIAGRRDQLAGVLQQKYGYAKDQAEKELHEFLGALNR